MSRTTTGRAACLYCSGPMPAYKGTGRPRSYCSDTCCDGSQRERAHLRGIIERLEGQVYEQVGRFVLPGQAAAPRLVAARQRLRDLVEADE